MGRLPTSPRRALHRVASMLPRLSYVDKTNVRHNCLPARVDGVASASLEIRHLGQNFIHGEVTE
jgi:hypothetical protein